MTHSITENSVVGCFFIAKEREPLIEDLKKYIDEVDAKYMSEGYSADVVEAYLKAGELALITNRDREFGLLITKRVKRVLMLRVQEATQFKSIIELEEYAKKHKMEIQEVEYYYQALKMESYYLFESFLLYVEKLRHPSKRFYQPRRKVLRVVVNDLQDLEDGKYDFYGLSMPPRVGKSTICIFFLAWVTMKRPNSHSAMGGHSGSLAKGFYKELLNIYTTPEYTFEEIYALWNPNKVLLQDKSSEEFTITLDEPDRFATITCRGIDGTWTGAVDISGRDDINDTTQGGYLYVDDLVRDREHSLSPIRMENTFQEYLNKMVDRKNDGAKELMVGTLWNVLDPLERLRKIYEGNSHYKFRRIPALNDSDQSNFNYEKNGFSTRFYRDMRARLDNSEWMAKYQQKPYVREGILFEVDKLRYFNGILPKGDHRIVAVVDVAWGGGDSLSMPIGAEYENGDVYVFDWIFSKAPKEITMPEVAGAIMKNGIQQVRFEGNQGGNEYCASISRMLDEQGYACSCTHKKAPTTLEKSSKIIQHSGDIIRNFVFLTEKSLTEETLRNDAKAKIVRYTRSGEYQKAMDEMTTYVTIGKNEHDDAVDGITQLQMFVAKPFRTYETAVIHNMFE